MRELFAATWPGESFDRVAVAFEDFDKLFTGRMPGYHGVDTVYHDRQHSLDMTLAMARLLVGYETPAPMPQRFGAERAVMALVTSLFHDAGYIREFDDRLHANGAEFTLYHVTRSARIPGALSCRPSAWTRGCRLRPASCISPATKSSSIRFNLPTAATASWAICSAPPT